MFSAYLVNSSMYNIKETPQTYNYTFRITIIKTMDFIQQVHCCVVVNVSNNSWHSVTVELLKSQPTFDHIQQWLLHKIIYQGYFHSLLLHAACNDVRKSHKNEIRSLFFSFSLIILLRNYFQNIALTIHYNIKPKKSKLRQT